MKKEKVRVFREVGVSGIDLSTFSVVLHVVLCETLRLMNILKGQALRVN